MFNQLKIAVMQPYIFPYIGYFQLINVVDRFIIYDDVNFRKRRWINRNKILVNNREHYFTIPIRSASQNRLINETYVVNDEKWKKKFFKSMISSYQNAPFFHEVFPIVKDVFGSDKALISDWCSKSIKSVINYLGISTELIESSSFYNNRNLKGQERILDICVKEKSNFYYNLIGGHKLYDISSFSSKGITLNFIKSDTISYKQFNKKHVPFLSIIDLMMFNSIKQIKVFLESYQTINPLIINKDI